MKTAGGIAPRAPRSWLCDRTLDRHSGACRAREHLATLDDAEVHRAIGSRGTMGAARMPWRGRFSAIWMKIPATLRGRSLRRLHMKRPVGDGRRSRCCSPLSNAYCDLRACGCVARAAPRTSACSPRPRRTFEGSLGGDRRACQWRHKPPTLAAPPPPRRRTAKLLENAPDAGSRR